MKQGNELTWAQVVMAANAPVMTKAALVDGRTDVGVLPTGQVVGVIESLPAWPTSSATSCARRTACSGAGASADRRLPRLLAQSLPSPGRRTLRHPTQQVRHALMGHPEEVGDTRDALALGAQRHHE